MIEQTSIKNQVFTYLNAIDFKLSIVFLSLSSIAVKNVKHISIKKKKSIEYKATEKKILFGYVSGNAIS